MDPESAKILTPFLPTALLQYVPKISLSQATTDCLTNNITKNTLHTETVIFNYLGGYPISHSVGNLLFVNILERYFAPKRSIKFCREVVLGQYLKPMTCHVEAD